MRNIGLSLVLVLCFCLTISARGDDTLTVEPDAQQKREAVLQWSDSLKSFSGQYTRTYVNLDSSAPDKDVPHVFDIVYRFQGDSQYMDFYSHETGNREQCAYFNGNFTILYIPKTPPPATITSKHFVKSVQRAWSPPWPPAMIFSPSAVFQQKILEKDISLRAYLTVGHSLLYKRDGKKVLIHRHPSWGRVEIALDDSGRVKQIVFANDWKEEDIAPYYPGSPLELYDPFYSYSYNNYEHINGVWFPLICVNSQYYGGELQDALMAKRNRGEISPIEAEVQIALGAAFIETNYTTIAYDKASLRINETLSDDEFRIDVPKDALPLDADGFVIHPEERWVWVKSHKILVALCGAALLFAIGYLVYWWRENFLPA